MQPIPEGYESLDFVGFTDRGIWSSTEIYIKNDIVHKDNTVWLCLVDNTTGVIPEEGEYWTVFIASETDSSGIITTDTEGIVGTAGEKVSNQVLIDAIADRVINKLMEKSMMSGTQVNDANKVPTSALAYEMQQSIDELNENLGGFHMYHSLSELGINPSTMTYQNFVNNMPANSILVCYIENSTFSPNSDNGCALFVKCTGSESSKKIVFETISMSGANSDLYMARYSAPAGTKWTGWKLIATTEDLSQKQNTITGAASTITSNNLTASRVLISNASGKVAVAGITPTELGYLDNAKSNIQSQIDNKNYIVTRDGHRISFSWTERAIYIDEVKVGTF